MNELVTTQWLAVHQGDVRVVDANWYMPDDPRNAELDYLAGHIPGAVYFDIDAIADRSSDLPHMMPSPAQFAGQVGAGMGLRPWESALKLGPDYAWELAKLALGPADLAWLALGLLAAVAAGVRPWSTPKEPNPR